MKKRMILCAVLAAVMCFCASAAYADVNVAYDGAVQDYVVFTDTGMPVTDLFGDLFSNMMPGDSGSERITIINGAENETSVKNYLRIESSGSVVKELLKQLDITITGSSGTVLQSKSGEELSSTEWKELGILAPGASTDLIITINAPLAMGNEVQFAEGSLVFRFKTEEGSSSTSTTTSSSTTTTATTTTSGGNGGGYGYTGDSSYVPNGKTGEVKTGDDNLIILLCAVSVSAAAIFAIAVYKKKGVN